MKFFSTLVVLFLCVVPHVLLSQNEYQQGYIVLNSGDTINGKVLDRDEKKQELFEKIKFKSSSSKRKKKYHADDIAAYGYGSHHFVSMSITEQSQGFQNQILRTNDDKDKRFLRVVTRGQVSYYLFEFIDFDDDLIDNIGYFLKQDESTFQRATQGIFGLKKKQLSVYFADCPTLVQRINEKKISEPLEVADFYNNECDQKDN